MVFYLFIFLKHHADFVLMSCGWEKNEPLPIPKNAKHSLVSAPHEMILVSHKSQLSVSGFGLLEQNKIGPGRHEAGNSLKLDSK